jgi:hypothetical protein
LKHYKAGIEWLLNRIRVNSEQLPAFLYKDDGQVKIGYHGDTVVTDEWAAWKADNLR